MREVKKLREIYRWGIVRVWLREIVKEKLAIGLRDIQ